MVLPGWLGHRTGTRQPDDAAPSSTGHPDATGTGQDRGRTSGRRVPPPGPSPSPRPRRSRDAARLALHRTLTSLSVLLAGSLLGSADQATDPATRPRPLQRLDTRLVLVLTLAVLVAISLARSPLTLLAGLAALLCLARWCGVHLDPFLRRVWLGAPVLTAMLVAPATLSVVTPGPVVVPVTGTVGLTSTGLAGAALVVGRVACSLTVVLTVTTTVEWTRILMALTALRVPRVFTAVVALTYRYALVLATVVVDAVEARRARTVRPLVRDRGRTVGHLGATVLARAAALSEEVHEAMVARGFTGTFPGPAGRCPGSWRQDLAASAVVAVTLAAATLADRAGAGWMP